MGGTSEASRRQLRDPDCWTILGLDPGTADERAVNERRRQLARELHPDRGGDAEAMRTVNAAADEAIARLRRARRNTARPRRDGATFHIVTVPHEIAIADVFRGSAVAFVCRALGRAWTLTFTVPRDARDGTVVVVRPSGSDVIFRIVLAIRCPPGWRIEGDDLYGRVTVPWWTFVRGGEVRVDGPLGEHLVFTAAAGTRPLDAIRVRGAGLYGTRGERGDIVVEPVPAFPLPGSPEHTALLAVAERVAEGERIRWKTVS